MGEGVLTSPFARALGPLRCEDVALGALADAVGTPAYVYSANAIRDQYRRLSGALAGVPARLHYSLKANSCGGILAVIRELGGGADVVSGGELFRARRAGFAGDEIVFGGVGKTARELREALEAGVLLVNVESEAELRQLDAIAGELGVRAPAALRINPEITVETPHHYTRTGGKGHKFGIPFDEVREVARLAVSLPHTWLRGLDMHVGSQLSGLDAYERGAVRLLELHDQVRRDGASELEFLDVGGGLAVTYDAEEPADLERYASIVVPVARQTGLRLVVEPGRFLVGNAGVLLTRVLYRKRTGGKDVVVTDAGMTELLRPSHYQAYHRIEAVEPRGARGRADVVGPVCESGDFFALDREVDHLEPGDLAVVHSVGAYGFAMASNYNSRPRPVEVMVDGGRFAVVTERETYDDLVRHERPDPDWRTA